MKKVFVGLSGGVDSAVSAALLKEQGHNVTGVFIKIWSPEFLECTWREDRLDAKRVAAHLSIRYHEIDLSKEYLDSVVRDMLAQYEKGFTPNPDVLCNRTIKFGAFADWALQNGADLIATGHYARIERRDGTVTLRKGIDPAKDQSYFLYRLEQKDFASTLFPVGGYTKLQIRALAKKFKLPNALRPDSQGLCFVGDVPMGEFLARFIEVKTGDVIDEAGKVIGRHDGAPIYTIGQRHGLHLFSSAPEGPYYVTRVDAAANAIYASRERANTLHSKAKLSDLHWIAEGETQVDAVSRYHAGAIRARISGTLDDYEAKFEKPLQLTPGQSLVFYHGDTCLGGAVIQSV